MVSNVKEFFEALDNNTEIIVKCKVLDFTLENLEKELNIENFYEHWTDDEPYKLIPKSYFLASGIVLNGYENLIIRSVEHTDIISNNDFDNILSFKNCKEIILEGFSIFHTLPTCNGAVLSVLLSNNISINNCHLNGSGGIGATLIGTNNVKFNNVEIFNNVFYAIYTVNSTKIKFKDCDIYENHDWGESVIYSDISDLLFQNCRIENNQSKNLIYSFLGMPLYVNFKNCDIEENAFNFDLQSYIDNRTNEKSKKGKRKTILKLFMGFLQEELGSDHDNRNNEFVSFFTKDYKIKYENQTGLSDFLSFYYGLKKKEVQINNFNLIDDDKVIVNRGTKNQEIWDFYFNSKNKVKEIKVKFTFANKM
ncbi:right-handed parallel beta-helix repeat-containing protein [Aquimarina algiphila]|nr:right-handed parallel beta-helix repeat-containing protein [Aquimarina algiphila]